MPQFVRYLVVGAFCAALEFIGFLFFHEGIGFNLVAANTIAYGLGLLSSFLFNKFWVFSGKQKHQTKYQFLAYALLAFFNYSLGTFLLLYMAESWQLAPWLAKGLSMGAIVVWNFLIYKKVIYR